MSRRRRATLMLMAAVGAGLLAVTLVGGYSSSVTESYGQLRPTVVVIRALPPGQRVSPRVASGSLEIRQVPARFVPSGGVRDPGQAIGLETASALPPGSYLTETDLRVPGSAKPKRSPALKGRHPVELSVAGAGAVTGGGRVDVLVTTDDDRGGGNTRVVAGRVPLIEIGPSGQSEIGPGLTRVTLALNRKQAIRLIDAESFARRITVLPAPGG